MKKIITLGLSLFLTLTMFAQHLDYENDSRWFFGLNAGAAWNTTDVANETHVGWGFIFGKQFNYQPGRRLSFDLRMRYLRGKWYGQDYDTTNLSHLGTAYNGALEGYQDNLGFTVNNFEADVHELGLELAIHANRIRERTGWDPYIFGGVNVVWNETYGDLSDQTALSAPLYEYDSIAINEATINAITDNIYDTPLDGSTNTHDVNFMPSLGFGLGYQVGPRFSIGVEHKTTFALIDDFDGYTDNTPRWGIFENDIYHYTSAYLRFGIRARGNVNTRPQKPTETTQTIVDVEPCQDPLVRLIRPGQHTVNSLSPLYVFKAEVRYVSGRQNIKLRVNGVETTEFLYNPHTHQLESNIRLVDGNNAVQVIAVNDCGTETESAVIIFDDCIEPEVSFENMCGNGLNVEQAAYTVQADVENATSIIYTVNGMVTNNYSYNATTDQFLSNITLAEGQNTIQITVSNECGTDTETIVVTYTNCADPYINFFGGNGGVIEVDEAIQVVQAYVFNVDNKNDITFRVNGIAKPFSFNASTNLLTSNLNLVPGRNYIQISTKNDCGQDAQTLNLQYTPCVAPVIQMISPIVHVSTVTVGSELIKAKVLNVTSINNIQLFVNGTLQQGGTFNAVSKIFEKNVALNAGINTVRLVVSNDCGTDTYDCTIRYAPCNELDVQLITPASNGGFNGNNTQLVQAMVFNATSVNQIQLLVNGSLQSGGSFNAGNSLYQHTVNLVQGLNTIQVVATNSCGSDAETVTVTHRPCIAPVVSMIAPSTNPFYTTASTFDISAVVDGVSGAGQIEMYVNSANDISGESYNTGTNTYTNMANLAAGNNVIRITATNNCGTVTREINVIREIVIEEVPDEEEMITICVIHCNNVGSPETIEIPLSQWPTYQAQGAQLGECPETQVTICLNGVSIEVPESQVATYVSTGAVEGPCPEGTMTICSNGKTMEIPVSQWANYQAAGAVEGPCPENRIEICLNGLNIEILESEWPAYQAQGATQGPCPEGTMEICFRGKQMEILLSEWAGYQAAGATQGPCPEETFTYCLNNQLIQIPASQIAQYEAQGAVAGPCRQELMKICLNGTTMSIAIAQWPEYEAQGATEGVCEDQIMTICLNGKQQEINTNEWPDYQAAGATQGPCPAVPLVVICYKNEQIEVPKDQLKSYLAKGATRGPCPEEMVAICLDGKALEVPITQLAEYVKEGATKGPCPEEMVEICFKDATISIPESQLTAYLKQGAKEGPCDTVEVNTDQDNEEIENEDGFGNNGGGVLITICHVPEGSTTPQTIQIPVTQWQTYQEQGAYLGPCSDGGGNLNTGGGTDTNTGTDDTNTDTEQNTETDNDEVENEDGFGSGFLNPGGGGGSGQGIQQNNTIQEGTGEGAKSTEEELKAKAEQELKAKQEAAAKAAAEQKAKAEAAQKVKVQQELKAKQEAAAKAAAEQKAKAEAAQKAKVQQELKAKQEAAAKAAAEQRAKAEAAQKAKAQQELKAKQEAAAKAAAEQKAKAEAAQKAKAQQELKAKQEAAAKTAAEQKAKAEAAQKAKAQQELKAKQEAAAKTAAEQKAKAEAAQKAKAQQELKAKQEAAAKAAAEQKAKAEAAQKAKAQQELKAKQEAARRAAEQKAKAEAARKAKEAAAKRAAEAKAKAEAAQKAKAQQELKAKQEAARKAAEQKAKAEAAQKAKEAAAKKAAEAKAKAEAAKKAAERKAKEEAEKTTREGGK